jgi:hypothetical protein
MLSLYTEVKFTFKDYESFSMAHDILNTTFHILDDGERSYQIGKKTIYVVNPNYDKKQIKVNVSLCSSRDTDKIKKVSQIFLKLCLFPTNEEFETLVHNKTIKI